MIERHKRWLDSCRPTATVMVQLLAAEKVATYYDVVAKLMQFYAAAIEDRTRAEVIRQGSPGKRVIAKAAATVGVGRAMFSRALKNRLQAKPVSLNDETLSLARQWATSMAVARANYFEAQWVFRRSLYDAALHATDGIRIRASRLLKISRNTIWRVPQAPTEKRSRKAA